MTSSGMANACEAAGGKDGDNVRIRCISAGASSRWHEFAARAIELEEKMLGKPLGGDRSATAGDQQQPLFVMRKRLAVRLDLPTRGRG